MDNLAAVYEAITPENLKNISVYDDSMKIFIELLEEKSKVSIQTENFFNRNITEATEEELIKIYLYDYYSMIQKILNNIHIINRFRKENEILRPQLYTSTADEIKISDKAIFNYFEFGGSIISENFSNSLFDDTLGREIDVNPIYKKVEKLKHDLLQVNPENFYFNRIFKETKGFYSSMIYIYDIINKYLTSEDERIPLDLKEMFAGTYFIGDPSLFVSGLTPDNQVLKIRSARLADPFKFKIRGSIHKTLYKNTVQYLSHPLGFVYDYSQMKQLKIEDYFSVSYTYINSLVEVRCLKGNIDTYDKPLSNVIKYNDTLKLIFNDLSYLYQQDNVIKYYDNKSRLVKEYPAINQCVIYYTYNLSYTSSIYDKITFVETTTLAPEKLDVIDNIKYKIKYSPKVGLLIGFFNFNSLDKFQDDTNIYNHFISDDTVVRSFKNMTVHDLVKIIDENKFNLKTKLSVESILFDDDIKSYKITLTNKEQVFIDENKKIKISTSTSDDVKLDNTKDVFTVKIPLNVEDKEIIIDTSMITSSNDLKESFKYNDGLKETLKFKLQDKVTLSDFSEINTIATVVEALNYNDTFKSSTLVGFSDEIDKLCEDDLTFTIISKFESLRETYEDELKIGLVINQKDFINIDFDENINFALLSNFKNSNNIGEYLIGDNETIEDSDYYKYYDNMDIS